MNLGRHARKPSTMKDQCVQGLRWRNKDTVSHCVQQNTVAPIWPMFIIQLAGELISFLEILDIDIMHPSEHKENQ